MPIIGGGSGRSKPDEGTPSIKPDSLVGNIAFTNVSFSYPSRSEVNVLTNFNMLVNAKQTVALVGTSGAGKSTVLALIQRYYDVNTGNIYIDGLDIRSLTSQFLHRAVSIVPQEPTLFSGTIQSNIM